ncbi:hypothetical protein ACROYT_G033545, partial [Oculina patagonica]
FINVSQFCHTRSIVSCVSFCLREAKFASAKGQKHFVFPRGIDQRPRQNKKNNSGNIFPETCFLIFAGLNISHQQLFFLEILPGRRRAPFDTSQVLIGPPCLNKVDLFLYLNPLSLFNYDNSASSKAGAHANVRQSKHLRGPNILLAHSEV